MRGPEWTQWRINRDSSQAMSLSASFHLAANQLRTSLGRRYLPMLCTLLFVVALAVMEWRYDIATLSVLSTALFEATLGGAVWPLAIVLAAGAAVLYASTSQIIRGLYVDDTVLSRPRRKVAGKGVWSEKTGQFFSRF